MALRVLPLDRRTLISNEDFPAVLQMHLDMPRSSVISPAAAAKNCCVDNNGGANKISFQHCVSCPSEGGRDNTHRHHDIARSLGDACTGAGIVATYESRRAGDGTIGVDLFVTLDGQRIAADITGVLPPGPSRTSRTRSRRPAQPWWMPPR